MDRILEILNDAQVDLNEFKECALNDLERKQMKKNVRKSLRGNKSNVKKMRLTVVLIASILALSVSVFAMSTAGILGMFFKDAATAIDEERQVILAQTEENGVILNVEEAINDGRTAYISFSLTKADGSAFDENTSIGQIDVEAAGERKNNVGYSKLIENNKKIVGFITVGSGDYTIPSCDINISMNSLIIDNMGKNIAEVNLEKLVADNQVDPLQLIPDFDADCTLDSAQIVDGKLRLQTTKAQDGSGFTGKLADFFYMKNIKTGEFVYPDMTPGLNTGNKINVLDFTISEGTELVDLKPVVFYRELRTLDPNVWDVSVKLNPSNEFVSKDIDVEISNKDRNMYISKVTISSLGVYLEGYMEEMTSFNPFKGTDALSGYVVLRDGQKKSIRMHGYNGETGDIVYRYSALENAQTDLDTGLGIFLSKNYEWLTTFVDLDEIESVIIEGEEIPIR